MASLSELTKKLNHPLEEVRQRSARGLRSKLDAGFYTVHDLALEPALPNNLVHMLGLPAVGGKMDAMALVGQLAADASASKQLASLGVVGSLQRLQSDPAQVALHSAAATAEHELVRQHGAPVLQPGAEENTPELPSPPPPPTCPPLRAAPAAASRSLRFDAQPASAAPSAASALVRSAAPPPLAWVRLGAAPLESCDEQLLFETTVPRPAALNMLPCRAARASCPTPHPALPPTQHSGAPTPSTGGPTPGLKLKISARHLQTADPRRQSRPQTPIPPPSPPPSPPLPACLSP